MSQVAGVGQTLELGFYTQSFSFSETLADILEFALFRGGDWQWLRLPPV